MLDALKFVKGAVAKKDFRPELTHFRITEGRITGYNGQMALSSPIDLDLEASPHAQTFFHAIGACRGDATALTMTPNGRLTVKSGNFRAYVECIDDVFFHASPAGDRFEAGGDLLPALKALFPLISDDASRPWAMGLLLQGESAFATNNVVLVQYWTGLAMPTLNVPRFAIQELLRVGKEPIALQTDGNTLTFHFDDGRWFLTNLFTAEWPSEIVTNILSVEQELIAAPPGFFDAVEELAAFVESDSHALYLLGDRISTSQHEGDGAEIMLDGLPEQAFAFGVKHLRLLGPIVDTINLSAFPDPTKFQGNRLRGAILGMSI
jgi:hypothetical protein